MSQVLYQNSYSVQVQDIQISTLLVATLSSILHALKVSQGSSERICKELESHLPPHDYYKTLLSRDHLPASIECFKVVDCLRAVIPRLEHAMEEWDEWRRHHLNLDGTSCRVAAVRTMIADIEFQVQTISIQLHKFEELMKRAETIISVVSWAYSQTDFTSVMN